MSLLPVGFGASGGDYEITDSLRFRSSASAYLSRTFASAGNRKTWTWSGWVKRGKLSDYQALFCGGDATSNNDAWLRLRAASGDLDAIEFRNITGGSYTANAYTSSVFRDPSAWYHIVIVIDTTQSTSTNRIKIYVNSEQQTLTFALTPTQNADMSINAAGLHTISKLNFASSSYLDAYLTEVNFIDGQALTADDFGEYDANGTWKAKRYTGTYGTNGFYLPMTPTTQAELQNTVLYTGNGSSQSINGYGFTPDFVWLKQRSGTDTHALYDTVRGAQKVLYSSETNAEEHFGYNLNSFDSDGFTVGHANLNNENAQTYVAWAWDAGDNQPSTGHSSVAHKANGSAGSISGFGFKPDLIIAKNRTNAYGWEWWDSIRGINSELQSNTSAAEITTSNRLISFDSDGFTYGTSSNIYVNNTNTIAWGWDAGDGDPVTNTDGSITSTVKANDATGFSIVSYTGNGTNSTVGHGLSSAPKMMIIKNRSTVTDWCVYHNSNTGSPATQRLVLNGTYTTATTSTFWNNTAPTSSVFSLGSYVGVNGSGNEQIAYCFSEVSGVSKFGSYTGNGSTTGPVITTGFRPGFLLVKKTSGSAAWQLIDGTRDPFANPASQVLYPNLSDAEYTWSGGAWNFTSTGFQPTRSDTDFNGNGETYIYMAFKGSYSDYVSPLNDTGTIDSRVKANPDKGFSIVSYEGTGANATVGHGLSSPLEMLIVKSRDDAFSWGTWHTGIAATEWLKLHSSAAKATLTTAWNSTAPTNSVFSLGSSSSTNNNNSNFIAYCFHSVAGYSDFGSYTGTGSSGKVVTTGFRPAFVMIKRIDANSRNWIIMDNIRDPGSVIDMPLYANLTNTEVLTTTNTMTFDANGFTLTGFGADTNTNGGTYIYMAFADTADARFNFDASGNKNNWLPNNINSNAESETTYDLMKDTPSLVDENAANFATLNPIASTVVSSISEANLKVSGSSNSIHGTIAVTSGKYYFEFTKNSNGDNQLGIAYGWNQAGTQSFRRTWRDGNGSPSWLTDNGTAGSGTAQSLSVGDILGVALDMDNNAIYFAKNNTWMNSGDPTSGASKTGAIWTDLSNQAWHIFAGSNANGCYVSLNCGQRPFAYTPPTGFKKLNTFNLPDSTIEDGSQYFNTVLYSGANPNAAQSITGVGFQPDLLWIKSRVTGYGHALQDVLRGATARLQSDTTSAESVSSTYVSSFDSDGFSLGVDYGQNAPNEPYVAWNWKAGGSSTSTNTDGLITSTVSVNTTAGFSIVAYTGTGSASTVGHGLGVAPSMIIAKQKNVTDHWTIYHKDLGKDKVMLFTTNAAISSANYWGTGGVTSTVFGTKGAGAANGVNSIVAYCFAPIEGYSAFGSYTGNGSTDGTFVYLGFRPSYVLTKRTNSAGGAWIVLDSARNTYNVVQNILQPQSAGPDSGSTYNVVDFLSNGLKFKITTDPNNSGTDYIYMAFAENPFKNANAR